MIPFELQLFAERTERATPYKRQEARKKGQVAHSQDLTGAVGFLAVILGMRFFGGQVVGALLGLMSTAFSDGTLLAARGQMDWNGFGGSVTALIFALAPVLLAGMAFAVVVAYFQVGPMFNVSALLPDFGRLNPIAGAGRMFSPRSFAELLKSIVKMIVLGVSVYMALRGISGELGALMATDVSVVFASLASGASSILMDAGVAFLALSIGDYVFQRFDTERNLRMSKEDVKEETKSNEGSPQMKRKMRERGRAIARRRMLRKVAQADVVVVNPTHYAVALAYDGARMHAPQVLAKGVDEFALRIRGEAETHRVPIVENPAVARALYDLVEVDGYVPGELFQAVAEVLAYVYRLKNRVQ